MNTKLSVVLCILAIGCGGGSKPGSKNQPEPEVDAAVEVDAGDFLPDPQTDAGVEPDSGDQDSGAAGSPADDGGASVAGRGGSPAVAGKEAPPPPPVIPNEDVNECWPADQQVQVALLMEKDDCGIRESNGDETVQSFVTWWNSDGSCNPVETISADGCTRTISRVCDATEGGLTISTTYKPIETAPDTDPRLLVKGVGTYSFPHPTTAGLICTGYREVAIRKPL